MKSSSKVFHPLYDKYFVVGTRNQKDVTIQKYYYEISILVRSRVPVALPEMFSRTCHLDPRLRVGRETWTSGGRRTRGTTEGTFFSVYVYYFVRPRCTSKIFEFS